MAKPKLTKFDKRLKTLAVKTRAQKEALLEHLAKYPIVQSACERAIVGRSTYYDWIKEDKEFAKMAEAALSLGTGFVNDMAESMLIKNIQSGNNTSLIFWLKNHHKGYNERIIHDHRYSIGVSEDSEPVFTPEEISAMARAANSCGFANVIKFNSGFPKIDVGALERELPEAEKIIAPEIVKREKEEKEYRYRRDIQVYGLSEQEHEEKERKIEEEKADEKRRETFNLKEYFRKHREQEKLREKAKAMREAEEKANIKVKKKGRVFNIKEYFEKKAKEEQRKQGI